ncbi:Zn finger [Haloarcula tailed virus 2]|uniref:Zn finger n=1 Tax=Haloarcula tailed virus 2 TaxID=2877989 RepID=A0AAE8XZY7_9CAUD|nr:Zn finger [Haloarcula tailed virus 2]UBF23234.1 Zn finger [Haloarcula tailed virus 2]
MFKADIPPCDECGSTATRQYNDGMTTTITCAKCGAFLAELENTIG